MKVAHSSKLSNQSQGIICQNIVERLLFNDSLLETELNVKRKNTLIPNIKDEPWQRIQELEGQLKALVAQFKQLKKELGN